MDPASSAYATAKKKWNQRNSDGKFCYDEAGNLTQCQSPPGFTFTEAAMPAGMSDDWTADAEYSAHAVLVEHVWDAEVSDPDE